MIIVHFDVSFLFKITIQDTLECCALGLVRNLNTALTCIWTIEADKLKQQAIAGETNISEESDIALEEKLNLDRILTQRQPYICNILTDDDEICCPDWMRQSRFTAIAIYPLFVDEKAIGILLLCDRRDFSDTILHALTTVANGIALGINRHLANIALQQAKEAAEAANLAKSQFLSAMSHELRTPLNAILGFSQILHQDATLQKEQRKFIGIIEHSGEHLLSLIDDVLSISKIEAGKATLEERTFSLDRLLDNLYSMFQLQTQSQGIHLSFDRSPDLPSLLIGDESKLRHILVNLLNNAIKFTKKGSINLQINDCSAIANNPQSTTHTKIHFEVRDTGSGIAPAEMPHIFAAFMQTESGQKSGQGTGLGLALTREFVELMGGEIRVRSRGYIFSPASQQFEQADPVDTEIFGAIFSLVIPFQLAEKSNPSEGQKPIALAGNQPLYRILIAEDLRQNRLLLRSILAPFGFEIAEAENGKIAISLWEQWRPHLILMDIIMPILTGEAATRQIRTKERIEEQGDPTLIIALTASAFDCDREQMLAAGCNDFLSKPFQAKILLEKIGSLLGIRYLYETSAVKVAPSVSKFRSDLVLDVLATMPRLWLEAFYQAASVADEEGMQQLIAEIPQEKADLARSLAALLDNFRVDLIFESVKAVLNEIPEEPADLQ